MAKKYYTGLTRDDGVWSPQFGDYDRQVVEDEMEDSFIACHAPYAKRDLKIIVTGDAQADIDAAVAKLNA